LQGSVHVFADLCRRGNHGCATCLRGLHAASPASGDTVTCTGTGNPAFIAGTGVTDLTVNINSGASITDLAETVGGSNPQFSSVFVNDDRTVTNNGTISPAVWALATRDNVGVNLNGSDTSLVNNNAISVTNNGSVSNTYRLYGVISSLPSTSSESKFDGVSVSNNGSITVTETGTATGVARGIYSGESIDDFTIDNYGSVSVSRTTNVAYSSSTVLAAIDSDDDTDTLIVNNHEGANISATGADSYTVGGRAGDYQINNDGTITNTGGKAAILIWLGGDDGDNTAEIDNSGTGVINGDVILSDELPLSPSATTYARNSSITNEGTVNGNFCYYGLGTHTLDNSGTITGNIVVDQTKYASTSGESPSFTFTNEGSLGGDITITDVSSATNSITLTGSGFNGNVTTTGNGSNSLTLIGASNLTSVSGFNFLDLQQSNVTVTPNGTTVTQGVTLSDESTLATTIFGPGGTPLGPTTNLGSLTFVGGGAGNKLDLQGSTTIVPTFAGIARNGDVYELASAVTGDTADLAVDNESALVTLTPETPTSGPLSGTLLLQAAVLNAYAVPGISNAGAATINNLLSYGGNNAALQALGGAVENLTDLGDVRTTAEQLRPEVNGASIQVPLEIITQFQSQIGTRLDTLLYRALAGSEGRSADYPVAKGPLPPLQPDNGAWVNVIGSNIQQQTVDNVTGYEADTGGLIAGYDRLLTNNFRLGGAFGYAVSSINDNPLLGDKTSLQTYQGIVYGSLIEPTWYANGSGGIGGLNYEASRFINFPGFSDTAYGAHGGMIYPGRLDGGYMFISPVGVFIPVASLTYAHIDQNAYNETSGAGTALSVEQQNTDSLRSGLGLKALFPIVTTPEFGAAIEGHAIWLHEFENTAEDVTAGFIGGEGDFLAIGPTPTRDMADVGADARMSLPIVGDSFSLSYDAILRQQYVEQVGLLRARIDF
jgi:uncharacterized protein with beta-barrel porin domain